MKINWVGYRYLKEDGYGRYGIHLIRALARMGVEIVPIQAQTLYDMPPDVLKMTGVDVNQRSIWLLPPVAIKQPPPPNSWIYTMHEDSKLPEGWAKTINQFERCIVPCEHNATIFAECGVTIPIDIVYGGTDPNEFPIRERVEERPYTFVCLADRHVRKGWDTVWGAWYEAFPESITDVRLIIKGRPEMVPDWFKEVELPDKRIIRNYDNVADMKQVFNEADCVVYPACGDGWGMWWREAAMMGLPALVTPYSGNAVGADEAAIPFKRFTMVESMLDTGGQWARTDQKDVAEQMRWCYEHQDEARLKGLQAAHWLRNNQTWDHSAQALVKLIEAHA